MDVRRKIGLLYLIVVHVGRTVSDTEEHIYGLVIDFDKTRTTGIIYEMETKPTLAQFPVHQIKQFLCKLILDVTKNKEDIVNRFIHCLGVFAGKILLDKEPKNVFPVLTGGEFIHEQKASDKDKFESLINEISQTLADRNYGTGTQGYFQPLEKYQEITFLAIAAEYDDMAEVVNQLNSTILLGSRSLHFIHPTEEKMKSSPLFDSLIVNVFDQQFHMSAVKLDCFGYTEMLKKYYHQIVEETVSSENPGKFLSPCHSKDEIVQLSSMKNECNTHMDEGKFPKAVTFVGTMNKPQCEALLKKAFCARFPKNIECPINGPGINILMPTDKEKPISFGGDFQQIQQRNEAKVVTELVTKIYSRCFSEFAENNDDKRKYCFKDVYLSFILNHFTHDLIHTNFISNDKTWHLGKILDYSRDIKESFDRPKKKLTVIISVVVGLALLVIMIGVVVLYLKKFKVTARTNDRLLFHISTTRDI